MLLDNFQIALIGRTNVGKSTLFNRIIRSNKALTFNKPGVTRDTKENNIFIFDKKVLLIDCPGMFDYAECDNNIILMKTINDKLNSIITKANIIIFVIDAIEGITHNDIKIANILRKSEKKVILAINKSEGKSKEQAFVDALSLGFSENISISSEHGLGINNLLECIYKYIPEEYKIIDNKEKIDINKPIKLAFIGRPNVGKSTLVNTLLKEKKQLVADFPGLTRESAIFDFEYKNNKFKIVDTPGIRRKSKIYDKLEKMSVTDSLRSYRHADSIVLVIDATSLKDGFIEKQDLTLASNILKDGKSLIIAFNKYDKTPYKKNSKPEFIKFCLERSLAQHKNIPFLFISAISNENIDKMMDMIINNYNKHKIKINTSKLNNWLKILNKTDTVSKAKVKLKYITQIGETPPTFIILVSKKDEMRKDQERFITNNFKEYFNLQDIIVKLIFKNRIKNA